MQKNFNIRTDLALEAHEFVTQRDKQEAVKSKPEDTGVKIENAGDDNVKITRVRITSKQGENSIGKPIGNYITLEIPRFKENDDNLFDDACNNLAKELINIIKLQDKSTVLVVGLGNWNVTPDALGPRTISKLMVTRHLIENEPRFIDEGVRPVCTFEPGVLGITGIETLEIVKGVVERVKPDAVICIDALASRKLERISTTIQIADTGISPGSGVGNKRLELSESTLGIPVIAIGVPTVVDAATMASDTIDLVIDSMINMSREGSDFTQC